MSDFSAKAIKNIFAQRFLAAPDRVFPLLCPVREYEWIEPWQCEMLYSLSGVAEKGCLFRTPAHGRDPEDVWIVSDYRPNTRIEFIRVNAVRAMTLGISLADNGDGTTRATNEQLLVGLTEEGNQALEAMAAGFSFEMRLGEAMLNHFLTKGERLPLQEALALARAQTVEP